MSNTDAAVLLKMNTNLSKDNKSINNIRQMDALGSILLLTGHPF